MKKALRMMQEMQAFLAERCIDAHVDVTNSGPNNSYHGCEMRVFDDDCNIVGDVVYRAWCPEAFEDDWAEFEAKVKERFFGWWE